MLRASGWITAALFAVGGVFLLAASARGWWPARRRAKRARRSRPTDNELMAFMNAWATPAYDTAKTLLDQARHKLGADRSRARKDLAPTIQRVQDDAARAYSLAFNALRLPDSGEPEAEFVGFFWGYQGMRNWVMKAVVEYRVCAPDKVWYKEWRARDADFLRELRQFSAAPARGEMLAGIRRVGWGEGVTDKLP